MRKSYTKPQILFENFALSTNIASGCETISGLQAAGNCGFDFSGLMVFVSKETGCSDIQVAPGGDDGEFNGICYHVPTETNNLFNS